MAKKQGMNLLEQHLEKVLLAAAAGVGLWVGLSQYVLPGRSASVVELADKGRKLAESYVEQMRTGGGSEKRPLPTPDADIMKVAVLPDDKLDARPWLPSLSPQRGQIDVVQVINVPEISAPTGVLMQLYRTQRWRMDAMGQVQGAEDVDFVTVEATLPLGDMRGRFEASFEAQGLLQPVKFPKPIVAAVRLQRSQLEADGGWGEWEDVPRLAEDPAASKALPSAKFSGYGSEARYAVLLEDRQAPATQLSILEPPGYPLPSNQLWLNPSAWAEQKKLEAAAAGPPGRLGPGAAAGLPVGPAAGSGPLASGPLPAPGTYEGTPAPGAGGELAAGYGTAADPRVVALLKQDQVKFWAHDAATDPGAVYRYRIQVGFFNPIAGRNWFPPEQKALQDEVVLWSPAVESDKIVKAPERILFFPKPMRGSTRAVASFEVYRWQHGWWYTKTYAVEPGQMIGRSDQPDNAPASVPGQEPAPIDFGTNVLLLGVIPPSPLWVRSGTALNSQETSEIVVRRADGALQRLPMDSRCWPQEWKERRSWVSDQVSKQRSATAPGTPGAPPMPPALAPTVPGALPGYPGAAPTYPGGSGS